MTPQIIPKQEIQYNPKGNRSVGRPCNPGKAEEEEDSITSNYYYMFYQLVSQYRMNVLYFVIKACLAGDKGGYFALPFSRRNVVLS